MNAADRQAIIKAHLQPFAIKSDLRGAWLVFCQWAGTLAIFAGVAIWPNLVTIVLGTVLLGGRQLGFFILTHESGHRTLFKTQRLNDITNHWLTSPLNYMNGDAYMREHLDHHRAAGTAQDPDLKNYADYPITRERLKRKLTRDLTGRTGARNLLATYKAIWNLNEQHSEDRLALMRGVVVNVLMIITMAALGAVWLYVCWMAALIFVYPAIIRIRQIAEHAAVPDLQSDDALRNTRTTAAGPLARLLICPHQVNYHVEHHLLASIPIYHLRAAHEQLKALGYFNGIKVPHSYGQVLRDVTAVA